jgi:hypothetical protein
LSIQFNAASTRPPLRFGQRVVAMSGTYSPDDRREIVLEQLRKLQSQEFVELENGEGYTAKEPHRAVAIVQGVEIIRFLYDRFSRVSANDNTRRYPLARRQTVQEKLLYDTIDALPDEIPYCLYQVFNERDQRYIVIHESDFKTLKEFYYSELHTSR